MYATVEWLEKGQIRRARWRSEAGLAAPLAVDVLDAANSVAALWQQMREQLGFSSSREPTHWIITTLSQADAISGFSASSACRRAG